MGSIVSCLVIIVRIVSLALILRTLILILRLLSILLLVLCSILLWLLILRSALRCRSAVGGSCCRSLRIIRVHGSRCPAITDWRQISIGRRSVHVLRAVVPATGDYGHHCQHSHRHNSRFH